MRFFSYRCHLLCEEQIHPGVLADNELRLDSERDARMRRIELQVEQQAAGLQMQVEKNFLFVVRIQYGGRNRK